MLNESSLKNSEDYKRTFKITNLMVVVGEHTRRSKCGNKKENELTTVKART